MRYRETHHTNHTLETPFGEVEIEHAADMADYGGALAHREGNCLVVAYLTHDDDCQNPLEDSYGMGKVLSFHRHSGQEVEAYEALGLDRYGEKDLNAVEDEVYDLWRGHIKALPDEKWEEIVAALDFDPNIGWSVNDAVNALRDELHDHTPFSGVDEALNSAERYLTMFSYNWEVCREVAPLFEFDVEKITNDLYEKAIAEGRIGNPYVVVLDCYDHGGQVWSITGSGMQCRWDTARGAGVWVPDGCLKQDLDATPDWMCWYYVRSTPVRLKGKDNGYQLMKWGETDDECVSMSDDGAKLWTEAERLGHEMPAPTKQQRILAIRDRCRREAQQALEQYNAWLSGDCYGVTVETFELVSEAGDEPEWEQVDSDSCWGFIGSDYAKDVMASEYFEPAVKALQNTTVTAE